MTAQFGQQLFELLGRHLGLQQQRWQVFTGRLDITRDRRRARASAAEIACDAAYVSEDLIDLPQQCRKSALAITGVVNERGSIDTSLFDVCHYLAQCLQIVTGGNKHFFRLT